MAPAESRGLRSEAAPGALAGMGTRSLRLCCSSARGSFRPALVAVRAAEDEPGRVVYNEENFFGKITVSSYRFGNSSMRELTLGKGNRKLSHQDGQPAFPGRVPFAISTSVHKSVHKSESSVRVTVTGRSFGLTTYPYKLILRLNVYPRSKGKARTPAGHARPADCAR